MRRQAPRVSVVIPAYNAARTLAETLASVQAQSLSDIEIIVVNDGSHDGTELMATRAMESDDRIVLITQQNAGVASARNQGAARARADRLAFLDADDLWHPEKLLLQDRMMEQRGAEVGLVYTWHCIIDENGVMTRWSNRKAVEGWVLPNLLKANIVGNGSSAFVRRSVFEATGGYDPSLRSQDAQGCEDLKFYLAASEHCQFAVCQAHLTGYRKVPGSMSRNHVQMTRSLRTVLAPYRDRYPESAKAIASHERVFLAWMLENAITDKDRHSAADIFVELSRQNGPLAISTVARAHIEPLLYLPRALSRSGIHWARLLSASGRRFPGGLQHT